MVQNLSLSYQERIRNDIVNGAKEKIQIIIVEDDNKQQEMYKDCIEEFNIDNPNYEIEAFQLANDQDVPKLIYNNHIDAIIVDLDILKSDFRDTNGKIIWALVVIFLPVIGSILYFLIGKSQKIQ